MINKKLRAILPIVALVLVAACSDTTAPATPADLSAVAEDEGALQDQDPNKVNQTQAKKSRQLDPQGQF